ncbi:DUF3014 domain-containing protein [Chromatocurvus halotolerans]|uniref:DUF3014 family protein n=1 Tax=Chromatocurvus halotolerans TaxID=1132028 RepID=A0A4R2KXL5_9GAMM|nr:DUF3014 domain-containing protein [Chromatocurvus halotolerans]TCO77637.1 DUF3014 family protein [Chromatocurvus halotolerans]
MQANRNQRLSDDKAPQRSANPARQTLITAVSVLILAVFAWLMLRDDSDTVPVETAPEVAAPEPVTPAEPPAPIAPDIPVTVDTSEWAGASDPEGEVGNENVDDADNIQPEAPAEPTEPPLTLANSDDRLREQLGEVFSDGIPGEVLRNNNLVERSAAAIDSIRRGLVPDRLLNLQRPKGAFKVRTQNDQTIIDPESYRRYDAMVNSLVDAPIAPMVSAFQRFRPLLEEAYGALGYAPDEMDNALIAALDQIQATPVIEGVVAVERSEAVWAYARKDLESLSLLQKQLLRTGPHNVRRIKEKARALREALLNP